MATGLDVFDLTSSGDRRMKILIVDDESLVRRSLRRAAESRHHQVEEAADGKEGLEKWAQFKPDLVFLDVLMPVLTGPEVLKQIQGQTTSKVVLISAFSGEYDLKTAQNMGADLFVPKPFENIFSIIEMAEKLVGA